MAMTAYDHMTRPNARTKLVMLNTLVQSGLSRGEAKAAREILIEQGAITDKATLDQMRAEAGQSPTPTIDATVAALSKAGTPYGLGTIPWATILQALMAALTACGL